MKKCTKCGCLKPLDDFHKSNRARGERPPRGGQGVASVCKLCRSEARKPGINKLRQDKLRLHEQGLRRCTKCGALKELSSFHTRKASPDGLAYKCADCIKIACVEWRKSHQGAFGKWYEENKEARQDSWRVWYQQNKERRALSYAEWAAENKDIVNACVSRRRAVKLKASPRWANQDAIRGFYKEAEWVTQETGIPHEVDHISPLQGKYVCGLHCEFNLQILTKVENIRKSNRTPKEYERLRSRSLDKQAKAA